MPDLFISYAREDRDTALALAQAFQRLHIDVWWDRELTGGGDFATEIERNLRAAPVVIVLWSAASVLSDFVRDESGRARDMQKLLPVRISPVELPLGFGTLHTLDLLDWDGDADDDACRTLVEQVRQRLAQAGPRERGSEEAERLMLARLASEDTLGHRRQRRRLMLALGIAGAAGVGALGWVGWQRFNRREALVHLVQALDSHFASPPRLETAQSEYARALELDDELAPAHYFLAHLYAQLMLRGSPPPGGDVLEALRADARSHFQQALAHGEQLDGAQRVIANSQLALLNQSDANTAVTRPVPSTTVGDAGAPPVRIDASVPPTPPVTVAEGPSSAVIQPGVPSSIGGRPTTGTPRPAVTPEERPTGTPPRLQAAPAAIQAARGRSEALFSTERNDRLAASTSLTLDPVGAAESLPSAIALARRALRSAPQADATRQGVASTLALAQRASPSTLREVAPALRELLAELAGSPLQANQQAAATRLADLLERSATRRPVAYLQIARESQRPIAQALARRLAQAGYVTPAIELTGEARAPEKPSLRSQGASDPDLARWCRRLLEEAAGAPTELAVLRRAQPETDTYELWFDKGLCAPGGRPAPECGA
jgi:tetratricopeptide (TPR) repeat protein